jgi:hypothetical protein
VVNGFGDLAGTRTAQIRLNIAELSIGGSRSYCPTIVFRNVRKIDYPFWMACNILGF